MYTQVIYIYIFKQFEFYIEIFIRGIYIYFNLNYFIGVKLNKIILFNTHMNIFI